jgi:hypothetical protein
MPALRIACCGSCCCSSKNNNNNHHKRNRNKHCRLLWWIADDDLRGIAKYAIILRCLQILILIPTLYNLIITQKQSQDLFTTLLPCDMRNSYFIVWSFWSSAVFTTLFSLILEIFMYVISHVMIDCDMSDFILSHHYTNICNYVPSHA